MIQLQDLVALTFRDPRAAAQQIIALNLSVAVGIAVFALSLIAGVIAGTGLGAVVPEQPPADLPVGAPSIILKEVSPFGSFLVSAIIASTMVTSFWLVGKGFGGTARPGHLIAVTAWADIFSTALSILVMLIGIITPIFGGMLVFAVTIVMVRVSILFLKEVHGFEGIGRAVAVFFLSILVSSFILSNIALMTGFLRIEIVA